MRKIYDSPELDVVKFHVNAPICGTEDGDDDVPGDFNISGIVDFNDF